MTTAPAEVSSGRDRLARSGLIALLGSVVNGVAAFGVVLAVTRGLGDPAGAGAVFSAMAVFNIAYIVSSLGADAAVVRAVGRGDRNEGAIVRAALVPGAAVSIAVAIALVVIRGRVAGTVGGVDPEILDGALLAVAPFIPAATVTSILMAVTRGRGEMTPTAVVERISRPGAQLALLGIAGLASASPQTTAALWAASFGLVAVPGIKWYRRGRPRADDRTHTGTTVTYWRFAGPHAVTTVFQIVLRWADVLLVAALADAASAAVYTAATRLLLAGNFLNMAVVQAVSPMIAEALGRGDRRTAEDLLRTGTAWLVAAVWPGYLVLIVFGAGFLDMFGAGYSDGAVALAILAAAMLVASAVGPIEAVLLMSGGSRLSLADNALAVGLNLALNVVLIPRHGLTGAAIAWAVGLLTTNLAPLAQVHLRLGIHPFGGGVRRAVVTAITTVLVPCVALRALLDPGLGVMLAGVTVVAAVYLLAASRSRTELALDDLAGAVRRTKPQSSPRRRAEPSNSGSDAKTT